MDVSSSLRRDGEHIRQRFLDKWDELHRRAGESAAHMVAQQEVERAGRLEGGAVVVVAALDEVEGQDGVCHPEIGQFAQDGGLGLAGRRRGEAARSGQPVEQDGLLGVEGGARGAISWGRGKKPSGRGLPGAQPGGQASEAKQ